jgi:hypothetical protein
MRITSSLLVGLLGAWIVGCGADTTVETTSSSTSALACSQGDPTCEEPGPGEEPKPPFQLPATMYEPDAMMQLRIGSLGCATVLGLLGSVTSQLPGNTAPVCDSSTGLLWIGGWRKAYGTVAQRQAALKALKPLGPAPENFALLANNSSIKIALSSVWSGLPKRVGYDFKADSGGPIHLDYWNWKTGSFGNVAFGTMLFAFTHSPIVPIGPLDGTFTQTDIASIDASSRLRCNTSDPSVDVDTPLQFTDEIVQAALGDFRKGERGPLCQIIDLVNPALEGILLPFGKKLTFAYSRITTGEDVVAGGMFTTPNRTPAVTNMTHVPAKVKVPPQDDSFKVAFSAWVTDLRPGITYKWSRSHFVNGAWTAYTDVGTSASSLSMVSRVMEWPRPNPSVTPTRVKARLVATDEDGLTVTAVEEVEVLKVGESGQSFPCETHPQLPQCQP